MAEAPPPVQISREAFRRLSRAARAVESQQAGLQHTPVADSEIGHAAVLVQVMGRPVLMTVPTAPANTTTTGTGTTDTSTTNTATTTTPVPRYVQKARFVYRNLEKIGTDREYDFGEDCWAYEVNDGGLGLGCYYPGRVVDRYRVDALVEVENYLQGDDDEDCTTTTSTTSEPCHGECVWVLVEDGLFFVRDSSTCSTECDCPPPSTDYCPPDEGCVRVVTYCYRGYVPSEDLVYCTTTTTETTTTHTGTTTSTTTTTPEAGRCGTGCGWKYVPDLPFQPYILVESDCNVGLTWREGNFTCTCSECSPPPPVPCVPQFTPCNVTCVPDPVIPPCTGTCTWVWPDVVGLGWVLKLNNCFSGGPACVCDRPSAPGDYCNQLTLTPCYTPGDPGNPAPNPGDGGPGGDDPTCAGTCYVRWDAPTGRWHVVEGCGVWCACPLPTYEGSNDGCTVAIVPCQTTTTETSTTTSFTTTTAAPACGDRSCTWTCLSTGVYALVSACLVDCRCPDVGISVGQACVYGTDVNVSAPCETGTATTGTTTTPAPTTTTTSTTTTETTTSEPSGCGNVFCVWRCNLNTNFYEISLNNCPENCECPQPDCYCDATHPLSLSVACRPTGGIGEAPPPCPPPVIIIETTATLCPDGFSPVEPFPGVVICVPDERTTTTDTSTTTTITTTTPVGFLCDLDLFAHALGSVFGEPDYDPRFDLNGDFVIDVLDFSLFRLLCPGLATSTTTTSTTTTHPDAGWMTLTLDPLTGTMTGVGGRNATATPPLGDDTLDAHGFLGTTTSTSTTTTTTTQGFGDCLPCPCRDGGRATCLRVDFGTAPAPTGGNALCCPTSFGVHLLYAAADPCYWDEETSEACSDPDTGAQTGGAWRVYLACYDDGTGVMVTEWQLVMVGDSGRGDFVGPVYACPYDEFRCDIGGRFTLASGQVDCSAWPADVVVTVCGLALERQAAVGKALGALVVDSVAALVPFGMLGGVLGGLTGTVTGIHPILGVSGPGLGEVAGTLTGVITIVGTAGGTLGPVTGADAGAVAIVGSLTKTLGTLTLVGTSGPVILGVVTSTLGALTLSSTGVLALAGTAGRILDATTPASSGALAITGLASPTLGVLTLSAATQLERLGSLGVTLGGLAGVRTGTLAIVGTGVTGFGVLTLSADGTITKSGDLSKTLGALTGVLTGFLGTQHVETFDSSASWGAPTDRAYVECWGGGAGGGGGEAPGEGGSGGGGGAYGAGWVNLTTGNNYTITVADGGSGGPGGLGNPHAGTDGGTSSFAADDRTISAPGGTAGDNGGEGTPGDPPNGGTGAVGDVTEDGGNGTYPDSGGGGGGGTGAHGGGAGGAGGHGGGDTAVDATDGSVPGGGGGGGGVATGSGNGASGRVKVTYYS